MAAKSILNDPPRVLEGPQVLHHLINFNQHALSCALDCSSDDRRKRYTYAEVQLLASELASRLDYILPKDSQAQPIIPVLLQQSPGLYISQIAILQTGGAFCPIVLDSPRERIKFIVGDVEAKVVITSSAFKDVVSWENGPAVLFVDEFPSIKEAERRNSPGSVNNTDSGSVVLSQEVVSMFDVQPHDLAYVMYTSGSTGKPKGVGVSHLAVTQSLLAHQRHIPPFSRFLQFASPSFDVSVFEIFFPLIRGCTLVGCDRTQLLNDLPGTINRLDIDAAELTPTVVGSLLQKRANAPGLKLLLTIGEPLTSPIVQEFGGSDEKSYMLYGMYGPTEAAIHCTIVSKMASTTKPGNIGVPFDTVSAFIATPCDDPEKSAKLEFLQIGEIGELIVGGPQVARGYLNRQEANKAAFIMFEGQKYYRTGDKARQLDNGTIEIFGRISSGQVKLRGQRVELGEIEEAVYKHPGVRTAVAVVWSGTLLVFALVGSGDSIKANDVTNTCSKWLPKYIVPSEIIILESFPYLSSGKVDKKTLQAQYESRREENEHEESSSASILERTVTRILKETLPAFSKSARLAASGLDSLLAIRVSSKLRATGINISTIKVLQSDYLRDLVQICEEAPSQNHIIMSESTNAVQGAPALALNGHADAIQTTMACTPLQLAMLAETARDKKTYINWVELEISEMRDCDKVMKALKNLTTIHPILRTGFLESPDSQGFAQIIWKTFPANHIDVVNALKYDLDEGKEFSLQNPVHFQMLQGPSSIKVLMQIHHALYDGWSLELLLDDFDALLCSEDPITRPNFSILVDAYANGKLKTDDWSSKQYWQDHLTGLSLTQLPNFQARRTTPGLAISHRRTTLNTSHVEYAAQSLFASPQSIFQATFAIILSSYLGSTDICFGSVFSGRTLHVPGIADIAGPCLATLPVRIDISASESFSELVKNLSLSTRKHLQHTTVPLRNVKSSAGFDPSRALFDTLFIWQQTLHEVGHVRKHVALVDQIDNLEFNLTLEVIPTAGNIQLKAIYQKSLVPAKQIEIFLLQIELLATAIVHNTSLGNTKSKVSLEDERVLSLHNVYPSVPIKNHSLSSPVEEMAAKNPSRPAICFAKSLNGKTPQLVTVSYKQLNDRANEIGHCLLDRKVEFNGGNLVGVIMNKSFDLYASILATVKLGAGYLPLVPEVPRERLKHILREAGVKTVLSHSTLLDLFDDLPGLDVIYVDLIASESAKRPLPPARRAFANLAYCVFTSGSTGTPKGVMVTRGNLLCNLNALEEMYPASKNSRLLQSCSQAFDVSVFEIFYTWRIGGCLCSATKDVLFQDLEHAIRKMEVTHLSLTPTVASLIHPDNVPGVRFLVTAGEAVTEKVFKDWAGRGLWQGYGPSETTNICTINPMVTKDDLINNVGRPLANTSAFVLSPTEEFDPVPLGGVGEFCFGGAQVFRGYMDPSQDVDKIINHPQYGRIYRSGDFGRMSPDGSLVFVGRKDGQVKINGQRVELGEIQSVVLELNKVRDCVVIVVSGKKVSPRLVCFWTPTGDVPQDVECLEPDLEIIKSLYTSLNASLPSYMIPSALIPISHLPSTAQGKIDKRTLAKIFEDLSVAYLDTISLSTKASSNHEWTDLERDIAKAVAQVAKVQVSDVGAETSFFNLGIDSISAIALSRTLNEAGGYEVLISDILKAPSVIRLAGRLSTLDRKPTIESTKAVDFGFDDAFRNGVLEPFKKSGKKVQAIYPCTPLQEAMLSATGASSGLAYDNVVTFIVNGDLEKLKYCWREMVRRHEILRTCFVSTDDPKYAFAQVVLADYELKFDETAKLEPLGIEPPYSLASTGDEETLKLVISMHHALYDGEALSVLYEEVEQLYQDRSLPPAVSFKSFLQAMGSIDLEEADKFWKDTLKNCSFSKLKALPEKLTSGQPSTRIHRTTPKLSLGWIESQTRQHSTTLLAVLHTVWVAVISETLQDTDICFGNVVSGRTLPVPDLDRLVAPCFNTIPSRLRNIHNLTYLEAFRALQTLNADSLPYQLTPLRRIQAKLSPDGSRLFDTLFIFQQPARGLDESIWRIESDSGAMDFPLVCEVVPKGDDTVELMLHFDTNLLVEKSADGLLQKFEEKLKTALENPRRQILATDVKENILSNMQEREATQAEQSVEEISAEPMSEDEKKLREIISDFTNVPREKIGRNTSIFRLGLDSISTVQVASRLRKQGHNVLASDILENPTIAKLSTFFSRINTPLSPKARFDFDAFDIKYRGLITSKHGIDSAIIQAIRPCTAVQQGMIAQTLHSSGQEYMNSMTFELLPDKHMDSLTKAWKTVLDENEMLRTVFATTDDPASPFVMVTYRKGLVPHPWAVEEFSGEEHSFEEQLLKRPWHLRYGKEEGRTLVIFTAHHALYDASSIQMLLADVATAYASQQIASRPPASLLLGEILQQSTENIEEKRAFWSREENRISVNKFPILTPLQVSDFTTVVKETISKKPLSVLEARCRERGVTMQAATQAAWARLLASYIGEPSTTFGMTLSGRSVHEKADQISFPSIVTLPVQCNVSGTNAELLAKTMESNALMHKHQFTPLTSIQKWAGYPEGKIFDTLFAYQKVSGTGSDVQLPWTVIDEEASVDYAVSLEVQPSEKDELTIRLTFRTDMIPVEQAGFILQQYDSLLFDLLENPKNQADVAPPVGRELLSITVAEESALPSPVTLLHEFVELSAHNHPDKIALEFASSLDEDDFQSTKYTYRQLCQESNKIANLLLKGGALPGEIVALCFDKSAQASFAFVGVLKAGCAFLGLDAAAPGDRLKFIAEDSGAKFVLTAGAPGKMLGKLMEGKLLNLDDANIFDACSSEEPELSRELVPQDISYCLYTSGTTGTPKGCLITHENAVQFILAFSKLFADHWTSESKYLQFASYHFDVSVMEQFWSWSVGICVASAPRDLIFDGLAKCINLLGITHLDLTPTLARELHPDEVPGLCKGAFITGGESLRQDILDAWGEKAVIYNGYGPTEVTIGCTMYPRVPVNGRPDNIGPAYINAGSYVMKPGAELPVLRGGVGELCMSGKLVGKGYLNRDDLTAERFPTLKKFDERVYRTGDLVRILHNGDFIFMGRADDQVKLRGQRLELNEINEVAKKSTPQVKDVVTQVLKHKAQQKEQLVAFFVANTTEISELISTLREGCKSRLPGYMVPTHFVPVEKIPLSANNKADKKQLAANYNALSMEELQSFSQSSQNDKAWSGNEKAVLEKIVSAIGVEVSVLTRSTTIFELGLDSISIIGFARALQESGFENAKLSTIKNNPSMDGLVKALSSVGGNDRGRDNAYVAAAQQIAAFAQRHRDEICNELGVESEDVESISPCTPMQQGMIVRFLESEKALYFNKFQFKLDDAVDEKKLLKAWNLVVEHLEVLRMKFVVTDDGYAQVVLKKAQISWHDGLKEYEDMEKLDALQNPYSFDIQEGVLTLQMFHGLYDGNSMSMLLQQVGNEYQDSTKLEYGPAFTKSLPYGPLANAPGAQDFWTHHLSQWSPSHLPSSAESSGDIIAKRDIDNLDQFETVRKKFGVTPQAVVQAVWLSVLQTISSSNLAVGIVTSGRSIDFTSADKVVGPLFNTVPFHARLENGMASAQLVAQCHEFNMRMQNYQHTPLKDIQKWSPMKPGQSLFESLFVFQRADIDEELFAKGIWTQVESRIEADYPLAFEATLGPDSTTLSVVLVAQGSVMSQSDADALLSQVEISLRAVLESCGENVILDSPPNANAIVVNGIHDSWEGHFSPTMNGTFVWTENANKIKSEIALLAKISEDAVTEYSSIFELGLDSIDVIKLSSKLKRNGIRLPVSAIIKSQTIHSMVPKIPSNANGHVEKQTHSLETVSHELRKHLEAAGQLPKDVEIVLPATPLQQTMVNEMIKSGYTRYFNIDVFKLSDDVDMGTLLQAIRTVIERSPALRTTFVEIDDPKIPYRFLQLVHNPDRAATCVRSVVNVSELASSVADFKSYFDSMKSSYRELAETDGHFLQVRPVADESDQYLIIAISHAIYDGNSLRLFHEDIRKAYGGSISTRPDYMPFLEDVFDSTTAEAKKFWRTTLFDLPPSTFPKKEQPDRSQITTTLLEHRSKVSIKSIEALSKSSRVTWQTLGQTCWSLVLSSLMKQLDVVFGSVLSCRDSEEANEILFPLMNTVAVRSVIHGTLGEMLTYMQELSDATRQYQHFPLGTAQAYAMASRQGGDTTLFDTLFIYQGRRQTPKGKQLYENLHGSSEVEFSVCVEMEIVDDEYLLWTTACKSSVRDTAETQKLLNDLDSVLERIVSSPSSAAIDTREDGTSVCGLQPFTPKGTAIKKSKPQLSNGVHEGWSDTELSIRKALHEISGVEEDSISKDTTIFHLGLDSILVLKLPALLKQHCIKLTVSNIMKEQTVAAMARVAQQSTPSVNGHLDVDGILSKATALSEIDKSIIGDVEIKVGKIKHIMPATAGQLYMIRHWQATKGAMFYQTFTYALPEHINKPLLGAAWAELLQRHDILRTGFIDLGDKLLQLVFDAPENEVIFVKKGVTRKSNLDLTLPPINLVVEDGPKPILKLVLHHALYDGISLPVLIEELQSLYQGEYFAVSVTGFNTFVAQSLSATPVSVTKENWQAYLKRSDPSASIMKNIPAFPRTEAFYPKLPKIVNIKKRAQKLGIGSDALILAAIAKTRAQQLLQQNIILGIYLANRAAFGDDLSNLAAPTLNLVPLFVRQPRERSLSDVAKSIQEDLQRIGNADMVFASLAEIYEWTGVKVDLFVNILKSSNPGVGDTGVDGEWKSVQDLDERMEIVDAVVNEGMVVPRDGRCDFYLPSMDIELRYDGAENIAMGVFAPCAMFSDGGSPRMITDGVLHELGTDD